MRKKVGEWDITNIKVNGKKFKCLAGSGCEYKGYGFPLKPYRFEKVIDKEHAFLIDAKGIIWTYQYIKFVDPPKDIGWAFERLCFKVGWNYIVDYYDKDFNFDKFVYKVQK